MCNGGYAKVDNSIHIQFALTPGLETSIDAVEPRYQRSKISLGQDFLATPFTMDIGQRARVMDQPLKLHLQLKI